MKIFVANIDCSITERQLEDLFHEYGSVDEIMIWSDWESSEPKSWATVIMHDESDAERAIENLNGKLWYGYRLRVCTAHP